MTAASALFRRQGLHATGMRDIASELDMHVGNLYYYFKDKQELLAYCQKEALASLLDLASDVAGSDLEPKEKLRRLIVGHVVCLNETTPGSLAHLDIEALEQPWREQLQAQRDLYESLIRDMIVEGSREGSLSRVDADIAVRALLGTLNWTVKWFRTQGPLSAEEIGNHFAELFLDGIRPRPSESKS